MIDVPFSDALPVFWVTGIYFIKTGFIYDLFLCFCRCLNQFLFACIVWKIWLVRFHITTAGVSSSLTKLFVVKSWCVFRCVFFSLLAHFYFLNMHERKTVSSAFGLSWATQTHDSNVLSTSAQWWVQIANWRNWTKVRQILKKLSFFVNHRLSIVCLVTIFIYLDLVYLFNITFCIILYV